MVVLIGAYNVVSQIDRPIQVIYLDADLLKW